MHSNPSPHRPLRRAAAALGVLALSLAACGGGDDEADDTSPDASPDADSGDAASTTDDEPGATGDDDATSDEIVSDEVAEPVGEVTDDVPATGYEPGPTGYRVVNATDQTVDVYVRTMGLVEAFEAQMGVEPGVVTDFFYPPADGPIVVTTAGAGDATCVSGCDHILSNVSAFDGTGDVHTLLLHDASGPVETFDLYEEAGDDQSSANALVAPDLSTALLVAIAIDLTDADFGLNLGYEGVGGCIEPVNLGPNILVGGNQTPAFAYDGDRADVVLFANDDRECTEQPVGGPFTIEGGPGSRTMLILTGSPGDMDALVVPFKTQLMGGAADADTGEVDDTGEVGNAGETGDAGDAGDAGDTGDPGGSGDSGEAEAAYAVMAEELTRQIGIDPADAACLAPYVVEAIGVDVVLVGGELVDLDAVDQTTMDLAFEGLIEGIQGCGIDPAILGG